MRGFLCVVDDTKNIGRNGADILFRLLMKEFRLDPAAQNACIGADPGKDQDQEKIFQQFLQGPFDGDFASKSNGGKCYTIPESVSGITFSKFF